MDRLIMYSAMCRKSQFQYVCKFCPDHTLRSGTLLLLSLRVSGDNLNDDAKVAAVFKGNKEGQAEIFGYIKS